MLMARVKAVVAEFNQGRLRPRRHWGLEQAHPSAGRAVSFGAAPSICTSLGGFSSAFGALEKYTRRSTSGNNRRTVLPWNSRLPATSAGCGIVVQQREQISISPARP